MFQLSLCTSFAQHVVRAYTDHEYIISNASKKKIKLARDPKWQISMLAKPVELSFRVLHFQSGDYGIIVQAFGSIPLSYFLFDGKGSPH